jgi:hypothetical protein
MPINKPLAFLTGEFLNHLMELVKRTVKRPQKCKQKQSRYVGMLRPI